MYFCTHENINVFISTDRSSFPNNKISIFTGRPPISSIFNSDVSKVDEIYMGYSVQIVLTYARAP
jgi:hypothetical protein